MKFGLFCFALFFAVSVLASETCTFKVTNHDSRSFEDLLAKGTVGNLVIPLCSRQGDIDDVTEKACKQQPLQTLFTHPRTQITCKMTNGKFMFLQFENDTSRICRSKKTVGTIGQDVVLEFPQDFECALI